MPDKKQDNDIENQKSKVEIEKEKKSKKKKSRLRENIEIVLWAILIALLIRIFLIESYKIPSQSLYPNFLENDHIIVNKFLYGVKLPFGDVKLPKFSEPKKGDIVIFQNPNYESPGFHLEFLDLITFSVFGLDQHPVTNPKNFIKRCMGTPGDTIEWIDYNNIKINGELLESNFKEVFDYNKVDWGKSAYLKTVDYYTEKNGEREYIVQYRHIDENNNTNIYPHYNGEYYMPKKGDILIIKRKNTSSKILIYTIEKNIGNNDSDNKIIEDKETIDVSNMWENKSLGRTKINGLVKIISEESGLDLSEDQILMETKNGNEIEYEIQHDYYFMIGDNRDNSEDGRFFGPVRDSLILGSPLFRYFPFNRFGGIY